jgi:hypothetical protein
MPQQLSFLDAAPTKGAAPVWSHLHEEHRNAAIATLARLIAKAVTQETAIATARHTDVERRDVAIGGHGDE